MNMSIQTDGHYNLYDNMVIHKSFNLSFVSNDLLFCWNIVLINIKNSNRVFRLIIYILLEYSIKEVYNNTILQGVGGNDGTGYLIYNNLSNIHSLLRI